MKAPAKEPAALLEEGAAAVSGGGLFLERAEYVSPDYARRLVMEFDWPRAAEGAAPWGVRLYVAKPHATSPHGHAWRLARRLTWAPSQRQALDRWRRWMLGGES